MTGAEADPTPLEPRRSILKRLWDAVNKGDKIVMKCFFELCVFV